jgi:hypothetical protein
VLRRGQVTFLGGRLTKAAIAFVALFGGVFLCQKFSYVTEPQGEIRRRVVDALVMRNRLLTEAASASDDHLSFRSTFVRPLPLPRSKPSGGPQPAEKSGGLQKQDAVRCVLEAAAFTKIKPKSYSTSRCICDLVIAAFDNQSPKC